MPSAIMEGLTATIIGMGIVFGVLALLSFVISFLKLLGTESSVSAQNKQESKAENESNIELPTLESAAHKAVDGAMPQDGELIAVITAAVEAFMGSGAFKIKSVKPTQRAASSWNMAARRENQRGIKY